MSRVARVVGGFWLAGCLLAGPAARAETEVTSPADMAEHLPGPVVAVQWSASNSSGCATEVTLFVDDAVVPGSGAGCSGSLPTPPLVTCVYKFHVKAQFPNGRVEVSAPVQATVDGLPPPPDVDGDHVPDSCDNCAARANTYQEDCDGDGVGDACDNCQLYANAGQSDADLDGLGDTCEFTWGDVAPRGSPDGEVNVGDVVVVSRWASGLDLPMTDEEFRRANVSPYSRDATNGRITPTPCPETGVVDIGDVVTILRASVGLEVFTTPF